MTTRSLTKRCQCVSLTKFLLVWLGEYVVLNPTQLKMTPRIQLVFILFFMTFGSFKRDSRLKKVYGEHCNTLTLTHSGFKKSSHNAKLTLWSLWHRETNIAAKWKLHSKIRKNINQGLISGWVSLPRSKIWGKNLLKLWSPNVFQIIGNF